MLSCSTLYGFQCLYLTGAAITSLNKIFYYFLTMYMLVTYFIGLGIQMQNSVYNTCYLNTLTARIVCNAENCSGEGVISTSDSAVLI
ncbi:hypothetical protein FKM82_015825 [Ascaphus truei]